MSGIDWEEIYDLEEQVGSSVSMTPLSEAPPDPEYQKLVDEYNQWLESVPLPVREKLGFSEMTIDDLLPDSAKRRREIREKRSNEQF